MFYASVVATVVLFMTGHKTPGAVVLAVMFGVRCFDLVQRTFDKEDPEASADKNGRE